jgi:hypothetical protein
MKNALDQAVPNGGVVAIIAGKHKGRTAYYDDDSDRYAYVYFGSPPGPEWARVRYTSMRKATPDEENAFHKGDE